MNVAVYKNLPFVATIPCFVRNIAESYFFQHLIDVSICLVTLWLVNEEWIK